MKSANVKDVLKFQRMVRDGRMGRRDFLAAMSALGIAGTAATGFLHASGALAATPRKGGTARFANYIHGSDDQMDPIVFSSGVDYTRGRATYNGLIQMRDNLVLAPELAEEWSANRDATEYAFKIRKGVVFHDGSPLTADDVVWSMNRHLGADSPSAARGLFRSVREWKKADGHTVKAILDTPDSDLPAKLTEKQAKIVKMDTDDFKKGNGTGPFILESLETGVRSIHVRNPDYWRDGANLEALEITAITDPLVRINALLAGDMDLINYIDPKDIARIEAAEGVRVISTPSSAYAGICILKNTAPGENDDFVKGIQFIQDRKRILRSVLKGHGTIGNDHPIGPAFGPDHCAELTQRPFDPDRAKFHLKRSGVASAEIHVAPLRPSIVRICLLMQANLGRIGFGLRIKKVPADGYFGTVFMKVPMNVVTWNMRPTANAQMAIQFAPDAVWNDTFWRDERMGKLLTAQLAETDPARRHTMLCEMQTLIHHRSGIVIPCHSNEVDGVSDRIQGIPNVPFGPLGGYEWPEFAWMDE